jgi:ligand-binding sensor domain-containing protein
MGWLRTALFVPMVIPSYVHALAWMRAAEWLRRVVAVAGIRLPAFQGFGAALWVQAIVSTGTGLPHNNVVSIRQMSDGTVWVGTGIVDQGGAVQLRRGADGVWRVIRTLDQAGGLAGNKARSIYVTRSGALIVGSEYEGMVVQTLQGFRVLTMDDGLSSDEVKSMVEDAQGNLWCATRDGLTVIDRETLNAIERGEL